MEFIALLQKYITGLDWMYIISLILICSQITQDAVLKNRGRMQLFLLSVPKGWRVFVVGLVFGVCLAWIRSYNIHDVEVMIHSFVFAMVFHQLIIKVAMQWLMNWIENPGGGH